MKRGGVKRVGELVENRPVYSVPLRATVAEAVGYMAERKVGGCLGSGTRAAGRHLLRARPDESGWW